MMDLLQECTLHILTDSVLNECYPFSCGQDDDMDEFFRVDALEYARFRMGKSYCFRLVSDPKQIVCCFTLSSDSIRIYDLPNSRKNQMWGITNREKILSRYPGVLIGRLAVDAKFARQGVGSQVLYFIQRWIMEDDAKMANRLAIVDAVNKPEVLHFYEKNGFIPLFSSELQEDLYTKRPKDETERQERERNPRHLNTRLMYFDLLNLKVGNDK